MNFEELFNNENMKIKNIRLFCTFKINETKREDI